MVLRKCYVVSLNTRDVTKKVGLERLLLALTRCGIHLEISRLGLHTQSRWIDARLLKHLGHNRLTLHEKGHQELKGARRPDEAFLNSHNSHTQHNFHSLPESLFIYLFGSHIHLQHHTHFDGNF